MLCFNRKMFSDILIEMYYSIFAKSTSEKTGSLYPSPFDPVLTRHQPVSNSLIVFLKSIFWLCKFQYLVRLRALLTCFLYILACKCL